MFILIKRILRRKLKKSKLPDISFLILLLNPIIPLLNDPNNQPN